MKAGTTAGLTRGLHDAIVIWGLLLLLLGPQVLADRQGAISGDSEGNIAFRLLVGALYVIALTLLLPRIRTAMRLAKGQFWLVALLAMAVLSTTWSVAPDITARRGVALFGTTIFASYTALFVSAERFVRNLAAAMAITLICSICAVAFIPSIGLHQGDVHDGAWRGLFLHKNSFSRATVLGMVVFFLEAARSTSLKRLLWGSLGFLALGAVLPTKSATGIVIVAILWGVMLLGPLLRLRGLIIVPVWLMTGLALVLILVSTFASLPRIFAALGRDPTLTGRTLLWSVSAEMGLRHPFVGHGFSAFWGGDQGPSNEVYRRIGGWTPNTGHSSYLDLWVDLGAVGLLLMAGALGVATWRAIRWVRRGESIGLVYLTILVFVMAVGVVESSFMRQNSFFWVVFAATSLYLGPTRAAMIRVAQPEVLRKVPGL